MAYQSYAQGGTFAPKETTTYLPALKENQKRIREAEDVYFDQMRRNDQTKIKNAEKAGDGLKALGALSTSLAKDLAKMEEQKAERDQAEGLAQAYNEGMYGEGTQERADLDAGEAELIEGDRQLKAAAGQVVNNNPENYNAAHNIKNMSGWKAYGYAMGKAQMAGMQYGGWMENALASDSETQITVGDRTFVPTQAKTPEEKAAAMSVLRKKFMAESGTQNVNPVLLAKYMFPDMYQRDAAIMTKARKTFAIDQSFDDQNEAFSVFTGTKDMNVLMTSLAGTVGANGQMLGMRGAWDLVQSRMTDMIKAGVLTEADIRAVEGQVQPGSNKTYGELHAARFELMRDGVHNAEIADYTQSQQAKKLERNKFEQEIIDQLMEQEDITQADIDAAEAKLDEIMPGLDSSRLAQMRDDQTVEGEALQLQEQELEQLAESGMLTPEILSKYHYKLQQKYGNVAAQQGKANAPGGAFKTNLEAIENDVKKAASVSRDSAGSGTVVLAVAELQGIYRQRFAMYQGMGKSNEDAAAQAYADTFAILDKQNNDKNARFYQNDQGFPNLIDKPLSNDKEVDNWQKEAAAIEGVVKYNGIEEGLQTKDLIFNQSQLENIEKNFGQKGFKFPPEATYWGAKFGVSPLAVINAQRTAYGLEPLDTPPALEYAQKVNPSLQNLLNRYQSPARSGRALGSVGTFEPSVVPNGYGDLVQRAATTHGIEPGLLAGLLETESAWNPNAVSRTGARGLGQIMPDYHQLNNYFDPEENVMYAAKFLKSLIDMYDGDIERAIYAYNGGPGNIDKLGPGFNKENREYTPKVLQSAYKYGFGAPPVRSTFRGS